MDLAHVSPLHSTHHHHPLPIMFASYYGLFSLSLGFFYTVHKFNKSFITLELAPESRWVMTFQGKYFDI